MRANRINTVMKRRRTYIRPSPPSPAILFKLLYSRACTPQIGSVCWSWVVGRGFEVVGRGSQVVGRGSQVVGRGFQVVGRGFQVVGRGSRVAGRGSWVVVH